MLALPSSLVGQLPFSSSSAGSPSRLGALIHRTRTRASLFGQLLRCIRSVDSTQFEFGCCERRGSCFSRSSPGASPRNWKATLQEAGLSEFAVCFTSGGYIERFLPAGKGHRRGPESWRFHDWSVRGGSGIYRDCFLVNSGLLFRATEKMTSVASRGRSRQLRERKETHISLSTQAIVRKKTKGFVAQETTSADDEMEPHQGPDESAGGVTEFEARLWDLDRSNKLTTLTVLELRGYMKLMSKPTAGRKDELISTVKEWLASRESFTAAKMKQAEATQETSSDAESLEGALLKAENKNREAEAEAMSRRTDLTAKRVNQKRKDAAVADDMVAQQDMWESAAPKLKFGDAPTSTEGKLFNDEELDGSLDEEIAVKATTKRKRQGKLSKNEEFDGGLDEEIAVKATTKRKTAVKSKDVGSVVLKEDQGKKRKLEKVTKDSQEVTGLQMSEEKAVEIIVDLKKPWLMLAHKKPKADWVVYDPETMRPAALPSSVKAMKLMSWNVNGLRALMKEKDKKAEECLLLTQLASEENFDVLCLQETKLQEKDIEQLSAALLPEYANCFWSCSTAKLGYSGTAIISRVKPLSVKYGLGISDHDNEGRVITVEFERFYLVTAYVPNSGDKLVRLPYRTDEWDPALSQYLKELEDMKPVVYTGDLNCANEEIDISNPDGNRKSAGFTNEERESFKTNFVNKGFVDTFRQQHPNAVGYTFWGYRSGARAKNTGWRLDYFLVSEGLMNQIHDSYIRPDVLGSDHCPIGLIVKV